MAQAVASAAIDLAPDAALNSAVTTPADAIHALRQVHDALAAAAASQGAAVDAQMLLSTILVRYPEPVDWLHVYTEVAPVVADYPARVIAIVRDSEAARSPRPVQVGLITRHEVAGSLAKRGELIVVALDQRGYDEAASLAASWAATGVPMVVWWNGRAPRADHLFDDLQDLADRIVVDSERMTDCAVDFASLAGQVFERERAQISDTLWQRLQPWRQAVAQLFDPQDHRADLAAMTRCVLTTNGTPAGQAAALLLIAWLGSRLGWGEPQRRAEANWSLARGAREVQVDIDGAGASGELVSRIEMVCANSTYLAELARPEEIVATAQRDTMPAARTVIDRPARTPQRDWLNELTSGGADARVYARAVELAQRLVTAAV